MRTKTLKPKVGIISLILCISTLSSCSIVRGLRTDGKNGPNIFSFEKREHDTIATGDVVFRFPVAQKQVDWIDTTHFYHKAHPCGHMTFGEAFDKESSTQGIVIIHNDSIVYERYWGDFSADRMANCVYHGYDFFNELNEQCIEHPDRTETICGTISNYIGMIRGGGFNPIDNFVSDDKINLKQLVKLFQDEIRNLYRFPLAQNPYFADIRNYYDELTKRHYIDADEFRQAMV